MDVSMSSFAIFSFLVSSSVQDCFDKASKWLGSGGIAVVMAGSSKSRRPLECGAVRFQRMLKR